MIRTFDHEFVRPFIGTVRCWFIEVTHVPSVSKLMSLTALTAEHATACTCTTMHVWH